MIEYGHLCVFFFVVFSINVDLHFRHPRRDKHCVTLSIFLQVSSIISVICSSLCFHFAFILAGNFSISDSNEWFWFLEILQSFYISELYMWLKTVFTLFPENQISWVSYMQQ
ncbi:hypothetical protein SDC9_105279 [bioreactor metagenome]|uniref:Uncharacterized protein n=1 Tax=bioreactor metagenome TaxID=1076179 RepID=A0A645B076_9ZZZZ